MSQPTTIEELGNLAICSLFSNRDILLYEAKTQRLFAHDSLKDRQLR